MKIKHLKINGFGKLENKEIELKDGINIIYGENESGKSTLLKFISSILYGASRNKNGKDISDFERYKPWKTEEYSGTIDYILDNNERYSVYREFKRKNPTIYNNLKEDITKSFKEGRSGIEFFTEQTGIDEEVYFNTAISEQTEINLSQSEQNSLVQRISNLISTGSDNISFEKAIDKIDKLQNENVGTTRTTLRPLNIVNKKIEVAQNKIKKLNELKNNDKQDNLEIEKLLYTLKIDENKLSFLKEIKSFNENNRIKKAEINFNKNLLTEDDEKIQRLLDELDDIEQDSNQERKLNKVPYIIISICSLIISIVLFLIFGLQLKALIAIVPIILSILIMVLMKFKFNKLRDEENKEFLSKKNKIKFELDNLKEKKKNKVNEINQKNEKIDLEIDSEKDSIVNKYLKKLDIIFIESILEKKYEELLEQIDIFEKKVSNLKLDIKELEISKRNYNEKLEEISKIEEELSFALEEREELLSLNRIYDLAKDCLTVAYEETKKNISPKFINNLYELISSVSNENYNEVILNDEQGVMVQLKNGNYVPLQRLSIGTIDQIYLSLRLSAIREISNEDMPIILDEAFAYSDDNRLENILKYLNKNYNNQILIFTCSNREKEVLTKLNIEYNLINLEK